MQDERINWYIVVALGENVYVVLKIEVILEAGD